jgi:hypothetical protein
MDLRVTRFTLFDPTTKTETPLKAGDTLDPAKLAKAYEVRARVTSDTKSVAFNLDGWNTEDATWPFSVAGPTIPGQHAICATPMNGKVKGAMASLSFSIASPEVKPVQLIRGVHFYENVDPIGAVAAFKDLGIDTVRITASVLKMGGWSGTPSKSKFDKFRRWIDSGFKTICCFSDPALPLPPSTSIAAGWAKRLIQQNPDLTFGVGHRWEVANEVNLSQWSNPADPKLAVDRILKPMFPVLDGSGHGLLGFSLAALEPAHDIARVKILVDAGYFENCREGSCHYYGRNADENRRLMAAVHSAWQKDFPILGTEVGLHPDAGISDLQLTASMQGVIKNAQTYLNGFCIYRLIRNKTMGGRIGLFKSTNLEPSEPFYTAFKLAA